MDEQDSSDTNSQKDIYLTGPSVPIYVNCLIYEMYVGRLPSPCVVKLNEPLPDLPTCPAASVPELSPQRVINRLKVMCELDPVTFKEDIQGSIPVRIGDAGIDVTVTFHDVGEEPRCELGLTANQPPKQVPPEPKP